jgi:hypothetical protein
MDLVLVPALSGTSTMDQARVLALRGTNLSGNNSGLSACVVSPVSTTSSPKKKKPKENHHTMAKARATKVAEYQSELSGGIPSYIRLGALLSSSAKKLGKLLIESHSALLGNSATKMSLVVKVCNGEEGSNAVLKLGYGVIEAQDGYPILGRTKE